MGNNESLDFRDHLSNGDVLNENGKVEINFKEFELKE